MGRNATITIKNLTGHKLTYLESDIRHGKFNKHPPASIENGDSASFGVGNRTGALIGPEGTVTYKFTVVAKNVPVDVRLVFYWNHPFARPESVYSVGSIPVGLSSFDLLPAQPTGHDQNVTLTVRAHDLLGAYDIEHWMGHIDGRKNLAELTIPGTHDSGALLGGPAYECQSMDIATQLLKGIRYLDIRCKLVSGNLKIFHGIQDMNLSFAEVQQDCMAFLGSHGDETIVMCVNREDGPEIAEAFAREIAAYTDHWHLKDEIPDLKNVRGKIVLLRRFPMTDALGIDATAWPHNAAGWIRERSIYIQDHYQVEPTIRDIDEKWQLVTDTCQQASQGPDSAMYINFTSGSGGITPVMLATGAGIILEVPGMNERLERLVAGTEQRRFGIVVMDFPEFPNEFLIPYIIGLNTFGSAGKKPETKGTLQADAVVA